MDYTHFKTFIFAKYYITKVMVSKIKIDHKKEIKWSGFRIIKTNYVPID